MNKSAFWLLTISKTSALALSKFSLKYESPHTTVATISASPLNSALNASPGPTGPCLNSAGM